MELKKDMESALEMPLSCKSALEKIEREIREEEEREKALSSEEGKDSAKN